jgi:hypothetical protein
MTPEEALRRIREAERTGGLELDLSGLELNRLPRELGRLTSLQSLNLADCHGIRGDLSPLAGPTSPPIARPRRVRGPQQRPLLTG